MEQNIFFKLIMRYNYYVCACMKPLHAYTYDLIQFLRNKYILPLKGGGHDAKKVFLRNSWLIKWRD